MENFAITFGSVAFILGLIGTIYGIYSNVKSNKNSDKKENTSEGRLEGQILSDLGYIKGQIDEVKNKQDKMDDRFINVAEKLAALTAFRQEANDHLHKLDEEVNQINERINNLHSN